MEGPAVPGVLGTYIVVGLLLHDSWKRGNAEWRVFYGCVFPFHVLLYVQLAWLYERLRRVSDQTWLNILFVISVIVFVTFAIGGR